MGKHPRSYLRLINSVTEAVSLINEMNFGLAKQVLEEGRRWAEELYIAENKGEVTSRENAEIFLRILTEETEAERELAEREEDGRIDAMAGEWEKNADRAEE